MIFWAQNISIPPNHILLTTVSKDLNLQNAVIQNTEIIDHNEQWDYLQYLDAFYIKKI